MDSFGTQVCICDSMKAARKLHDLILEDRGGLNAVSTGRLD